MSSSSGVKRPRETPQQQNQLLVGEIQTAKKYVQSKKVLTQRTQYIKNKLESMSEEEQSRFEFFVRSHLPRDKVRAIMEEALGNKEITSDMAIVASSLTKLFIGEICDAASDVVRERKGKDGIQVEHIQEAYRRLKNLNKVGIQADHSYLFQDNSLVVFGEDAAIESLATSENILSTESVITATNDNQ